jgi:hypothetical protein
MEIKPWVMKILGILALIIIFFYFSNGKESHNKPKKAPVICNPEIEVTEDGVVKGHFYRCPDGTMYYGK